jgi:acetyl esterase/lipase
MIGPVRAAAALIPLLIAGAAFAAEPNAGPGAAGDLAYGPYPIETLQVCQPSGDRPGARPAALVIHGGAWVSEDRRIPWFASLCQKLADRGVVAFNINYRLIRMATGENAWPAQVQDVQLAMRWLRAHAQQFNVDPNRVCAFGTSAGGNLAALLGIERDIIPPLKGEDPQHETSLYSDQSPQASCVVDVSGPTDLTQMPPNSDKVLAAMAAPLAGDAALPQALAQISPINRIKPGSAPVLIIYGTMDQGVPPASQALPFYKALKDRGVPATLFEYTGHHALGLTAPEEVDRALDAASAFIKTPG